MKTKIKFIFLFSALTGIYSFNASLASRVIIDGSQYIRSIPDTLYGTNMQCWDGKQAGGDENVNTLFASTGCRYVRWPGGSWGDAFLWNDMEGPNGSAAWRVSYDESLYFMSKFDGIMQPIVNFPGYWYDTDHNDTCAINAAAAWVTDQSSRFNCARYWEIGNETGGPWEAGWFDGISGVYYGNLFAQFSNAMKAINPRIKLGAVCDPCDTFQPYGWYEGKWTRDLLDAADSNYNVRPDFLIVHSYPGTDQSASYNPALLSGDVMLISAFTYNLNTIIATSIGDKYVGKIKYWMTEWDAGGGSSYNRDITYVSALFKAQYILEMAKYGWEGSNPWSQNQYHLGEANYPSYYVYPKWYVPAILKNYFGRDMVYAISSLDLVRIYAARDEANNLTVFLANNSPTATYTINFQIQNFNVASSGGLMWLIQPAGSLITGGVNNQDYNDLKINDAVHPEPRSIASLAGIPVSNPYDFNLPASTMAILKIPPAVVTEQLPYNSSIPWPIPGIIEAEDYDTGGKFVSYYDTNSGNSGGQYRSDDVDIEVCSEGGFDVNGIYPGEWLEYSVDVNISGIYKITAHYAAADSNGQFRIEFDGQNETGPVLFTPTGDAQVFGDTDVNAFLKKGTHTMRLLMDTNGFSIDKLTFTIMGEGTGKVLREFWTGISGSTVSSLTSNANYPNNPTGKKFPHSFEGPTNWADAYGTRFRGYLHPVASGTYYFYIASDDASELWLSTDDNPANAVKIAQVSSYSNPYQWDKASEQKSSAKSLAAGQTYYIEARHKESSSGDNLTVAWQGPGILRQVISGQYLSPYPTTVDFMDFEDFADQWLYCNCKWGNNWCSGSDINRDGIVTADDVMAFTVEWLTETIIE